jgi:hypothetical protein
VNDEASFLLDFRSNPYSVPYELPDRKQFKLARIWSPIWGWWGGMGSRVRGAGIVRQSEGQAKLKCNEEIIIYDSVSVKWSTCTSKDEPLNGICICFRRERLVLFLSTA